jgi:serine acetyltransferase
MFKKSIKSALERYDKVAIWGAGGLAELALKAYIPQEKVSCVITSSPPKNTSFFSQFKLVGPEFLVSSEIECIIICSSAILSIKNELKKYDFKGRSYYIYELIGDSVDVASEWGKFCVDYASVRQKNILKLILTRPQIIINFTYRMARYFKKDALPIFRPLYYLFYFLHYVISPILSVQLPLETDIGAGFVIAHYGGIVFTPYAKIGRFFTVYQGCTVGRDGLGHAPKVGDFVTMYAGSYLIGKCDIGDYTLVGANSTVLGLSAPKNSVLVGTPAKIKRNKE